MVKKNIVVVQFDEYCDKTYDFFNVFEEIEVGDTVVVDTQRGIKLTKVVELKSYSSKATKHVIQKVELEAHKVRIEEEKRRTELEEALRERQKEIEKLEKYKELAQKDEKMAALLAEYEKMNG